MHLNVVRLGKFGLERVKAIGTTGRQDLEQCKLHFFIFHFFQHVRGWHPPWRTRVRSLRRYRPMHLCFVWGSGNAPFSFISWWRLHHNIFALETTHFTIIKTEESVCENKRTRRSFHRGFKVPISYTRPWPRHASARWRGRDHRTKYDLL